MVNYKKQQAKAQRKATQQLARVEKPLSESLMTTEKTANGTLNLQFTPIDTWFFRESRPHDAVGATELNSLFPPPIRTLMGALRRFLGDSLEVNWKKFNHAEEYKELKQLMGDSESLGKLNVNGAWVCKNGQRLYPAPFYLMQKGDNNNFVRLQIGDVVECDLGNVRLPELPKGKVGYKNLEQTWITAEGWELLLKGETPSKEHFIKANDLFDKEPRLGIARNNQTRTVLDGKLYQTQHLRLKADVTVQIDLQGLAEKLISKLPTQKHQILRLGGEGRMASLTAHTDYQALPTIKADNQRVEKFIIHFITAADFNGRMFPADFTDLKNEKRQVTSWQGKINGITFIIEAAVIGKVHREGGWDMQNHKPRAVKSYIPAGSAWFCRIETVISATELVEKLNGYQIGNETEWGRGQILIGVWNDTANGKGN